MDDTLVDNDTSVADEGAEPARHQEELRQEHDRYLRARADFENHRRRVERDRERMAQEGKRDLVMGLLDIIDDFERALAYAGSEGVAEGLRATHRRLLTLLENQGVTPFA